MDIVLEWRSEAWDIELEFTFPVGGDLGSWAVAVSIRAGVVLLVDLNALEVANERYLGKIWVNEENTFNIEFLNAIGLNWVGVSVGSRINKLKFVLATDLFEDYVGVLVLLARELVVLLALNHLRHVLSDGDACQSSESELVHIIILRYEYKI